MPVGFEESISGSGASFTNSSGTNEAGDFECNICFELAQDPIITLCGHLFCWPCLYKWLHHHSQSQECPVCKALIQEEKLVPLYGRGKNSTGPRSRPVPGADIPRPPSGQRPETAPPHPPHPPHSPPEANYFSNLGFGLLGGFVPMATARFGNMTMSAGFGGLFPSIPNFQLQGFPDPAVYGATHGLPYAFGHTFHAGHDMHSPGYQRSQSQGQDSMLKTLFLLVGVVVVLALLWS